nr:hypothetical protein [Desulfobaculum xiamenense]
MCKLARQLLAYDEASLVNLWEKYAEIVESYEPTARWEEAVVVLGMIQSVRFRNQLINHHTREMSDPGDGPAPVAPEVVRPVGAAASEGGHGGKGGKLLRFRPRQDDETV